MDQWKSYTIVAIAFFIFIVLLAFKDAWGDRIPIAACSEACKEYGVASVSMTECRCRGAR